MVEAMANSVEDYLIDGLSFKLSPGASYVQDRRSVSYFTAGSNIYQSGTGARVIRINLTGDGWLDPSTVRLVYTLRNNAGQALRVIGGPWSFFRRVRCLVGGAIVDDVDFYNRVHEMLHILSSKNNRDNDDIEGFGYRWDSDYNYSQYDTAAHARAALTGIAANSYRTVSFKPLIGLFSQSKYIPLMWCPLTLEFEIVSSATDAIGSTIAGGAFEDANTSTAWQIEDVRVVCDVVTLDSALQNSYAEHVLSGKALPINYGTYVSILQACAGPNINVNVTRAVSRLKTLFFNFDTPHNAAAGDGNGRSLILKDWNSFVHPMGGAFDATREVQWQVQIGSKLFPEYPCRSAAQTYYELKKALGIASSAFHSISPTMTQFINDHFLIGVDTERILEAGFTGLNTRSGDLMSTRVQGANGPLAADFANKIYIILHSDQILEVRDTKAFIFQREITRLSKIII